MKYLKILGIIAFITTLIFSIAINIYLFIEFKKEDDNKQDTEIKLNDVNDEAIETTEVNKDYNIKIENLTDNSEDYKISIAYPVMSEYYDPAVQEDFNSTMMEEAQQTYDQTESILEEFNNGEFGGGELSFESEAIVTLKTDTLFSINIRGYQYTGGAHGISVYLNNTYDIENSKLLDITDLFKDGSNFLEIIADKSREILIANYDLSEEDTVFMQGTEPEVENYSTFYLTEDSLVIIFTDYQIGPYALGNPEVEIPFEEIKEILKIKLSD